MTQKNLELTIMFADVVGSTRLYEALGDVQAFKQISQCLTDISMVINQNDGEVVKTIGDEIMCRFSSPDAAVKSACEIQELLSTKSNLPRLQMRIGLQYGPVVIEDNDVFGDTINVAARLVKIAGPGQIFTSEETVKNLSPVNQYKAREMDRIAVKGKQEEVALCQIIWEKDTANLTSNIPIPTLTEPTSWTLHLCYQSKEKHLNPKSPVIILGRNDECDVVVHSPFVSRCHARFELRRGKIILTDQSTNGTYVQTNSGTDVYLHREEFLLTGEGTISLGTPVSAQNEHLIFFKSTPDSKGPIS